MLDVFDALVPCPQAVAKLSRVIAAQGDCVARGQVESLSQELYDRTLFGPIAHGRRRL